MVSNPIKRISLRICPAMDTHVLLAPCSRTVEKTHPAMEGEVRR